MRARAVAWASGHMSALTALSILDPLGTKEPTFALELEAVPPPGVDAGVGA